MNFYTHTEFIESNKIVLKMFQNVRSLWQLAHKLSNYCMIRKNIIQIFIIENEQEFSRWFAGNHKKQGFVLLAVEWIGTF